MEDLRQKLEAAGMPEEVKTEAMKELNRLARISPASPEYSVTRTYLEWMAALPWSVSSGAQVDVKRAAEILDEDHYDLEKVKDRILDYLAVLQLQPVLKGPILCFVGPPGVGKTSLGRSIARALGRKFARISMGGMHDEAEIRGHRRTYIGALPGPDHPGHAARRHQRPGLHAGRSGQARPRFPRRPGLGAARSARPRAELHLPR